MSRFVVPTVVLLVVALGCARKTEPTYAFNATPLDLPRPSSQPAPPDGSIPPPREVKVRSRAEALALGVDYLLKQQSADGAWRSDVYATFKDGTALTPFTVTALQEAHDAGVRTPTTEAALNKGCAFLAAFTKPDGTVTPPADGFDYPLYTAALTLKAFSHSTATDFAKHRAAWVKYLKERQLTEPLGWKPEEKQYGGWGYCRVIPKKPEPGAFAPNLIESNLSATVFALDALKAADETDAEVHKAVIFVRRCQNGDGGFHFIYDDPVRNKAGVARTGPLLFHSYGSTTADGLRALAHCNDAADDDRREAARKWLVANFLADHHPGTYAEAREPDRDAVYFYFAASAAQAFRDHKLKLPSGRDWAEELSYELASRQAKDGRWTNRVELVRENDPIVATCSAVLALARLSK
jgi:hypothetical protein